MSLPWFRMYHEFAGDPVIQCLAFEDQRHFVMVLCLKAAGFLDREWPSDEIRHRMICHALGLDPVSGSEAKRRLMEVSVVSQDWQPANWDKRQFQSDFSTIRSRNWREKRRETLRQRCSDVAVTAQDTDTDTDTDTEQRAEGSAEGSKPSRKRSGQPPPSKPKLATRIPDEWQPSADLVAYAEKELPNVNVPKLLEEFTDYWRAAAGARARKLDWDATWRTWVRRAVDRYPVKPVASVAPARPVRIDPNGREIHG